MTNAITTGTPRIAGACGTLASDKLPLNSAREALTASQSGLSFSRHRIPERAGSPPDRHDRKDDHDREALGYRGSGDMAVEK